MIASNRRILTPYFLELIEEGNPGWLCAHSVCPGNRRAAPLLTSLWLLPSVFPGDQTEMRQKFSFIGDMLEKMGIPLMDEAVHTLVDRFVDQLPDGE